MSFTRIPNEIIDESKLNPYQFQIFSIIVRKTDGWCKVEDGISLSQFEKLVTFKKPKIISTLKELEELELIIKVKNYDEKTKQYSFSTYRIHDKIINGVVTEDYKGSNSELQGVVTEDYKQKKLTTKETNTKQSEYDKFIEYLKKKARIKSKITKTKEGKELFKNIKDKRQLAEDYLLHQEKEGNYAKRITSFIEDYETVYKTNITKHEIFGEYTVI